MGIKPSFEIYADGNLITPRFVNRLVSLSLTDEAGETSDALNITLEDSAENLELPRTGAELKILLGYKNELTEMGFFLVDSVNADGPPDKIHIEAKAAPFTSSSAYTALQTRKSRSFEPQTVAAIVSQIAQEHGLESVVSESLAEITLPHLDQTEESDVHFLTRVARDLDAIAKPQFQKFLFVTRGEAQTATGETLPAIQVHRSQVTRWNAKLSERSKFNSIICHYHDTATAKKVEIRAGDQEPVFQAPKTYPNAAAAERAAQSLLKHYTRSAGEISFSMPGNMAIFAESRIELVGFRKELNAEWIVSRVEHLLSKAGLITSIEATKPNTPPTT
jgi:phage protein D